MADLRRGPPDLPKIYHITHVDNLPGIVASNGLFSDRIMITSQAPVQAIGMSEIKRRRVNELDVGCHPGTKVGDYVPFYFCPRSVMLYVISRGNHRELTYSGGQGPIVHLEADLHRVVAWAGQQNVRWVFSLTNAGARYTEFRFSVDHLQELDWQAIEATDWSPQQVKEAKQAEFLVYERFPLALVDRVGVCSVDVRAAVEQALRASGLTPSIEVQPGWYY